MPREWHDNLTRHISLSQDVSLCRACTNRQQYSQLPITIIEIPHYGKVSLASWCPANQSSQLDPWLTAFPLDPLFLAQSGPSQNKPLLGFRKPPPRFMHFVLAIFHRQFRWFTESSDQFTWSSVGTAEIMWYVVYSCCFYC